VHARVLPRPRHRPLVGPDLRAVRRRWSVTSDIPRDHATSAIGVPFARASSASLSWATTSSGRCRSLSERLVGDSSRLLGPRDSLPVGGPVQRAPDLSMKVGQACSRSPEFEVDQRIIDQLQLTVAPGVYLRWVR
jgi:hypothetical protein